MFIIMWNYYSFHPFVLSGVLQGHSTIMRLREEYLPYETFKEVDYETSNTSIGLSALGIIVAFAIVLIIADLATLYKQFSMLCRNVRNVLHR